LHNKYISLAEYINNMKPNQNNIFYLSGDTVEKAKNSPQLEGFIKNDIDVLLFTDTVDDFWVSVLHSYKDKEMKSVTRSGIELDKILNPTQENETADSSSLQNNQTLIDHFKQTLASLVSDIKISGKLVDSPVCLAVAEGAMDIRMERYLKDQKQLGQSFAKIIEINVNHPIIKRISNAIDANDTELAQELELALFDQACILEGEPVNDLAGYSKRMNNLLGKI
jgi:molecular chaperone HtpG